MNIGMRRCEIAVGESRMVGFEPGGKVNRPFDI